MPIPDRGKCKRSVSIVIPSWNGSLLLDRNLPKVMEAMKAYRGACECLVVDDGSTDDSLGLLARRFPSVRAVARQKNSGFSSAVNAGLEAADNELVLLLNNDVEVSADFIEPLVRPFLADSDVFAVSSLQLPGSSDGAALPDGCRNVQFTDGHLQFLNATPEALAGHGPAMGYASGGCSLFSKAKLAEIGNFCPMFDPFYCEDTEVGLQALKRGWRIVFVPESKVIHQHGTSTRRRAVLGRLIPVRNLFLLHWMVLDGWMWREHLGHVVARAVGWTLCGRVRYLLGLLLALLKLPEVVTLRRERSAGSKLSMVKVLAGMEENRQPVCKNTKR